MTTTTKIKIVFWIIVFFCAGVNYFHMKGVKAENAALKIEASTARAEAAGLERELKLNYQALQAREAEKERLANEYAALVATIEEVYLNDPDAKAWADTPCPDGIVECLLQ